MAPSKKHSQLHQKTRKVVIQIKKNTNGMLKAGKRGEIDSICGKLVTKFQMSKYQ